MNTYALNQVTFGYDNLDEAFPTADCGHTPLGSRVIVQIRTAKRKTKHGIILPDEVQETERWNTQVAKVIAAGPVAFHNRNTLEPWPEGAWAYPGDYVRVPKYGGDRWSVKAGDDEVMFVIFNDLDLIAKIDDPLAVKAFI